MSVESIARNPYQLPSDSSKELVDKFAPALRSADSKAKTALNAFKSDPTNQAKAMEAQQAQSALDNLWRSLSAMIESMGKTIEAILSAMRM